MAKGEIIPKILEILQTQAEATVDLLNIFIASRPESYRRARRMMLNGPDQFKTDWADWYRKRQSFYSLLNQLKNQGLVQKESAGPKKSIWKITKKGLEKFSLMKNKERPSLIYKEEEGDKFKVIIFDIPEREKDKRSWIREVLRLLGFTMLQKSVWIGKKKIPAKFLFELKNYSLMRCVHIFEINQKGSIGFDFE